jgi:hypothetical protein
MWCDFVALTTSPLRLKSASSEESKPTEMLEGVKQPGLMGPWHESISSNVPENEMAEEEDGGIEIGYGSEK